MVLELRAIIRQDKLSGVEQGNDFDNKSSIEEALDNEERDTPSISASSSSNSESNVLLKEEKIMKERRKEKKEDSDEELVSSSITLPSNFATTSILENLGRIQATTGEFFRIYELPGTRNNCGLAGIYGRRVDRSTVVQQLLRDSSNEHIRALMATDIVAYISDSNLTAIPTWLQGRVGDFENLEQLRQLSFENEVFRREFFQNEETFREYVINVIGAENSPTLRYSENNQGAMAAIAALNHASLDIYQEFRQIDGSRLLVRVFSYEAPQIGAPLISLLHMSQDPTNTQLNHFQHLEPQDENNFSQQFLAQGVENVSGRKREVKKSDKYQEDEDNESSNSDGGNFGSIKAKESNEENASKNNTAEIESLKGIGFTTDLEEQEGGKFWLKAKEEIEKAESKIADLMSVRIKIGKEITLLSGQGEGLLHKVKEKFEKELKLLEDLPSELKILTFSLMQAFLKNFHEEVDNKIREGIALKKYFTKKHFTEKLIKEDPDKFYIYKFLLMIEELRNIEIEIRDEIEKIIPKIIKSIDADIVNRGDSRGRSPLHTAAENGNLELARLLLEQGAGAVLNVEDDEGDTPLHLAIRNRHASLVPILLPEQGYTPIRNANGCTPLELAVEKGLEKIVYMLYKRRVNYEEEESLVHFLMFSPYEIEDETLNKLVLIAAKKDLLNVLKAAVEREGDINSRDDRGTALHWAARRKHIHIVKFLLQEGADFGTDDLDRTALHVAAHAGHLDVVKLLINKKQDIINILDYEDNSALYLAIIGGHFEVVKFLLKNNADISNQNVYGKTPYDLLLELETKLSNYSVYEFREQLEILKILLNTCPNVNVTDARGLTAMDRTMLIGDHRLINLLLKRGANLNIDVLLDFLLSEGVDPSKISGLNSTFSYIYKRSSIYKESVLVLKLFLNPDMLEINEINEIILITAKQDLRKILERALFLGGSINARDHNGLTALHWAAYNDCSDIVKILLEKGAEVDTTDHKGRTPLHLAAKRASLEVFQLLANRGADLQARDNKYRGVYDLVEDNENWQEIINFIQGGEEGEDNEEREDEAAFL